ncbi:potassium/sodium hyperpolarization-activated cyclic nucleotide-gated channel 1-like [Diachasmimorpha longicaudata]|uniref:potassium/sodium hyperpolarization-activated cyclic nucleotide-gated channel 1-like n=1 Tax=Diachasmimorpha longicaudata TaxID=58733 RepID=UPI0030B8DBE9
MYKTSFQKMKIIEMLMISITCLHWATCLELYIPLVVGRVAWESSTPRSWLSSDYMKKRDTIAKRYISSLNRATTALMSSSHYLPVITTEDIILNLILTILGRIGFIYVLAQLLQLMTTFDSTKKRNVREVQQFYEYMKHKELPYSIQQRVFEYYEYYQKNIERNKMIISHVSQNLREELLLHEHEEMIEKVNVLRQLPQPVLCQVLSLVKSEIYLPNDSIVKSGTPGDSLFYITCGTVAVVKNTGEENLRLTEGSYFGETCLITEYETCLADVIALELCELSVLKRSDFLSILSSHTNLLNKLQRFGLTRLK